jgi:hypothetical protein
MAEARQAVAFQFAITDEGISLHFDKTAVKTALSSFFGTYKKRFQGALTALYRGVFPASPISLAVISCLVALVSLAGYDTTFGVLPLILAVSKWIGYSGAYLTSLFLVFYSVLLWILLSYALQFMLKALLMYKGFMFEPRG